MAFETRDQKRIRVDLKGEIILAPDLQKKLGLNRKIDFTSNNLSLKGTLLKIHYYLPKNIDVSIRFSADKKIGFKGFKIPAFIKHIESKKMKVYTLGVEFKKIDSKVHEAIKRLLKSNSV